MFIDYLSHVKETNTALQASGLCPVRCPCTYRAVCESKRGRERFKGIDAVRIAKKQKSEGVIRRQELAHIIHDASSRNRGAASRDGRAEPREAEAYRGPVARLRATGGQYVEAARGEPAHWHAFKSHASLSQQRIGDCSRSAYELCGLGPLRDENKSPRCSWPAMWMESSAGNENPHHSLLRQANLAFSVLRTGSERRDGHDQLVVCVRKAFR